MNGADHRGAGLRAAVRAAIACDDLVAPVRAVLEARFPADGAGASLDEAGAALGMSPAMVAHIEFAALCAIAARRSRQGAAVQSTSGPGAASGCSHAGRGRA